MEPLLKVEGVCKYFGGVVAAEDAQLTVFPSEVHGLIGPNGAGKTTLLNLISGIYSVDKGKIFFLGKDVTNVPSYDRARMGLGRTFQSPRFLQRSSIRENLLLGTDLADQLGYWHSFMGSKGSDFEGELKELMKVAGFTFNWDDEISALPYGQRKLLEIVRSMLSNPKVMLVDEPAAGLNSSEIDNAMALLNLAAKERKIGVVLIEHSMDMVMNICHEITVISFGKVIGEGTPEQVSSNEAVIEAYLGRKKDVED